MGLRLEHPGPDPTPDLRRKDVSKVLYGHNDQVLVVKLITFGLQGGLGKSILRDPHGDSRVSPVWDTPDTTLPPPPVPGPDTPEVQRSTN